MFPFDNQNFWARENAIRVEGLGSPSNYHSSAFSDTFKADRSKIHHKVRRSDLQIYICKSVQEGRRRGEGSFCPSYPPISFSFPLIEIEYISRPRNCDYGLCNETQSARS